MLTHLRDNLRMGEVGPSVSNWKPLGLLNLYRLLLSGFFLALILQDAPPRPLGEFAPHVFLILSLAYLTFTIICALTMIVRWPAFHYQLYIQIPLDIIFITLLMHASGGISSGLGILLVVAIAAGSILSTGRMAILFAAIASLAILGEQIYSQSSHIAVSSGYTRAGLLGATFFATALLANLLAKRMLASEALASQRGEDLAQMAELTNYIVQRMQTGIVVLGMDDQIRLMNESAWHLLDTKPNKQGQKLNNASPALAKQLRLWRQQPQREPDSFSPSQTSGPVLPRFAKLGGDESSGTLIFLEDTSGITQQAQHLKLASLGRLTASIAHEIRNPLAAISYAGQLLAESSTLDNGDMRFTQIIREQSQRMNKMIENILQLSRRNPLQLADFKLQPWLGEFITEFTRSQNIEKTQVELELNVQDITVRMDPSQLQQVLWNLCENGLRYAPATSNPKLKLRVGILPESQYPFLDVMDFGAGIAPEIAQQIFEPFFTTQQGGTGLGLYIARELCESNQARLSHTEMPIGTCFRITFADPRRRQVA